MLGGGNLNWLRQTIISEAKKKDEEAEEYQLDEESSTPDDEGDNPSDENTNEEEHSNPTDEGGVGEEAGEYQLDSEDENDSSETDSTEAATDDEEVEAADENEEDDDVKLKKLILLNQFKELNTLINNLTTSIVNLEKKAEFNNDEDLEYLHGRLEDLKLKISFTLQKKFLDTEYQELLKLFYHFKFNLNNLANFAEKLIKDGNN